MAISYINTAEVEDIAKEVISLANEFNTEINNLFNRFSEVPNISKEWVGSQSSFYFKRAANDKKIYNDFANKLKDIGYKLYTDIYEVQICMKKNITEESQKGS